MKKLGIFLLSIIIIGLLFVAGFYIGIYGQSIINPKESDLETTNTVEETTEPEEEIQEIPDDSKELEMYESILDDYKKAMEEYDADDVKGEEKLEKKYKVNAALIAHIHRYEDHDIKLTYSFCDIDQNDVKELVIGASGTPGAIYSFDEDEKEPVKIFYQDTLERGNLSIYDNGIILSSGSGGAAVRYYEFGKISDDGVSYEQIEQIEETYKGENTNSTYKDFNTKKKLDYKDTDEIMEKYVSDSKEIKLTVQSELE